MGILGRLFGRIAESAKAVADPTDYSGAALDALWPKLPLLCGDVGAWIDRGGNRGAKIAHAREKIAELRKWSASLENRAYAAAIDGWLDWSENSIDEYEDEVKTGLHAQEMADYDAERERERAENKRIGAGLPKP